MSRDWDWARERKAALVMEIGIIGVPGDSQAVVALSELELGMPDDVVDAILALRLQNAVTTVCAEGSAEWQARRHAQKRAELEGRWSALFDRLGQPR